MSISMVSGGTTINLQNPIRGEVRARHLPHAVGRTLSGQLYAYKKGPVYLVGRYTWEYLRDDEREDLENFFYSTVEGPSNTFTFTDHYGTTYVAQFLNDFLDFENIDDSESSSGTYVASGTTYPTTTRTNPVWRVSIELELTSP